MKFQSRSLGIKIQIPKRVRIEINFDKDVAHDLVISSFGQNKKTSYENEFLAQIEVEILLFFFFRKIKD